MTAYVRVYLANGMVAHYLDPGQNPHRLDVPAICQRTPWFDTWRGTRDQAERDQASAMPLCAMCTAKAAARAAAPTIESTPAGP